MRSAFTVTLVMAVLLSACTQKVVCPAYQSAFIYDKDELRKKFSYFHEDATPKIASAKKTKYLIAQPVTYRQKERSLRTVEMKPVRPLVPDSLLFTDEVSEADLARAARSVIDSIYIVDVKPRDTAARASEEYVISIDREARVLKYNFPDSLKFDPETGTYVPEKPYYYVRHVGFNLDQDSYMWYLRDVLVLPDVRLAGMQAEAKKAEERKERKGLGGFLNNLFGKKGKKTEQPDDAEDQKSSFDREDYNYDEFEDRPEPPATTATGQPLKQKKGILSVFGKKDKPVKTKSKPVKDQPKEEAEKNEDEDDGF